MTKQDSRELEGKVALVTGAGSGIGAASARRLAESGATVGLLGRTEKELEKNRASIERAGGKAHVLLGDVSKAAEVRGAIEELVRRSGRLDIVFANAGVNGVWAPIDELSDDEWEQTLAINLTGTFFTIKYAAPFLKRQGGSVIVCSSVNGTRMFSNTGATAYSVSKAGQVALAKMLAVELARDRIRLNVLMPGAIDTEIDDNTEQRDVERVRPKVEFPEGAIPLTRGKPGRADQVAELVFFLASDHSDHITGTEIWIDGGQSLVQG
jgi:NAD(P)-dependent dehydrogenase (short-subunit alcohol dehydrogenase family)